MAKDNPFLSQVVENPDDDDARLVYADYLEEQDDPRGEFIRVQCALATTSQLHPDYLDLQLRGQQLLRQYGDAWAKELKQDVRKIEFHRGFISTVTALASKLTEHAGELFKSAPIDWLRLNRVKGFGERLAKSPAVAKIRHLDVSRLKIPAADLNAILRSPHLTGLTKLNMDHLDSLWDGELAATMNAMVSRERLKWLSLRGELTDSFVRDLAAGPGFPALEHFCFGSEYGSRFASSIGKLKVPSLNSLRIRSPINKQIAEDLCNLPLHQMHRLDLTNSRMPAAGIKRFAEGGAFDHVEELLLSGVKMGIRAAGALFRDEQLANCRVLEFGDYDAIGRQDQNIRLMDALVSHLPLCSLRRLVIGYVGAGHIAVLAACPQMQNLESLGVPGTRINAEDFQRISTSEWPQSLRALDLSNAEFGDGAFDALSQAEPTFERLLRLDLSGSQIGYYGSQLSSGDLEWIMRSCNFPELQHLDVSWNHLTDRFFDTLAEFDLPNLRYLDCRGVRLSEKAIRRVLESDKLPNLQLIDLTRYNEKVAQADYGGRVSFEGSFE